MDLKSLKRYLNKLALSLDIKNKQLLDARLSGLSSVFPFNEYEYMLMFLFDNGAIDFRKYEELRKKYVSGNKHRELYGLAPRVFGEIWAHKHILDINHAFQKPNNKLDPKYNGEYDLWLKGIKIELKSCRAINRKKRVNVIQKALHFSSNDPFWMNFQQIKADAADVFLLIGVWVDKIIYWVMSKREIKKNKYLSHQHRGGIEFQIRIDEKNIKEFDRYRVLPSQLVNAINKKAPKRKQK